MTWRGLPLQAGAAARGRACWASRAVFSVDRAGALPVGGVRRGRSRSPAGPLPRQRSVRSLRNQASRAVVRPTWSCAGCRARRQTQSLNRAATRRSAPAHPAAPGARQRHRSPNSCSRHQSVLTRATSAWWTGSSAIVASCPQAAAADGSLGIAAEGHVIGAVEQQQRAATGGQAVIDLAPGLWRDARAAEWVAVERARDAKQRLDDAIELLLRRQLALARLRRTQGHKCADARLGDASVSALESVARPRLAPSAHRRSGRPCRSSRVARATKATDRAGASARRSRT